MKDDLTETLPIDNPGLEGSGKEKLFFFQGHLIAFGIGCGLFGSTEIREVQALDLETLKLNKLVLTEKMTSIPFHIYIHGEKILATQYRLIFILNIFNLKKVFIIVTQK